MSIFLRPPVGPDFACRLQQTVRREMCSPADTIRLVTRYFPCFTGVVPLVLLNLAALGRFPCFTGVPLKTTLKIYGRSAGSSSCFEAQSDTGLKISPGTKAP